jgi:hypothetical protein
MVTPGRATGSLTGTAQRCRPRGVSHGFSSGRASRVNQIRLPLASSPRVLTMARSSKSDSLRQGAWLRVVARTSQAWESSQVIVVPSLSSTSQQSALPYRITSTTLVGWP